VFRFTACSTPPSNAPEDGKGQKTPRSKDTKVLLIAYSLKGIEKRSQVERRKLHPLFRAKFCALAGAIRPMIRLPTVNSQPESRQAKTTRALAI
jgi:hypothetical protein